MTGCGFDSRCDARKRVDGFLRKIALLPAINKPDSTISMMHRVWPKGTALRAVGRKPRVGSNPTHANTSNVNIQQSIKTLRLKIFRHLVLRRFESCLGWKRPSMQEVKAGLLKC